MIFECFFELNHLSFHWLSICTQYLFIRNCCTFRWNIGPLWAGSAANIFGWHGQVHQSVFFPAVDKKLWFFSIFLSIKKRAWIENRSFSRLMKILSMAADADLQKTNLFKRNQRELCCRGRTSLVSPLKGPDHFFVKLILTLQIQNSNFID